MVPYNPNWPELFIVECNTILEKLDDFISSIHHVGSTAIINAYAKPVIDIAIESRYYPPNSEITMRLASLGYKSKGNSGVTGRHWYWKGTPRSHHIHWCPVDGEVVIKQLAFRDKLSSLPELVTEYSRLKCEIASLHEIDSAEYAAKKSPFIEQVLNI